MLEWVEGKYVGTNVCTPLRKYVLDALSYFTKRHDQLYSIWCHVRQVTWSLLVNGLTGRHTAALLYISFFQTHGPALQRSSATHCTFRLNNHTRASLDRNMVRVARASSFSLHIDLLHPASRFEPRSIHCTLLNQAAGQLAIKNSRPAKLRERRRRRRDAHGHRWAAAKRIPEGRFKQTFRIRINFWFGKSGVDKFRASYWKKSDRSLPYKVRNKLHHLAY